MKLYFNENFEVVKRDEEDVYRGSEKFNELHIYFPRNAFLKYHAIYPIFSYKRSDGREGGELAFTQSSSSNDEWYEWYDVLPKKALEINGVLQITVAFKSVKNENDVIKKTVTGKSLLTIKDAVVSDTDIIYTDSAENTVKSMTTQIDAARVSIESLKAKYVSVNLGTIYQDPYLVNHTLLNNIKEANTYHFNFQNNGYLMFIQSDENSCVQTVIYTTGLDSIYEFNRSYVNNVWSIGQKRKLANTNDVELLKETISRDFQKKLIDAFDADTILESINQNGKASVEQALISINYWATQIRAFIKEVFTDKIVNKAIADQKGNVIDAVYQPKLISGYSVGSILGDINEIDGKASIEKSLKQINVVLGNFNQYISNIVNGTTVVDKAKNDRNGNVIDLTYATKNALTALENKISQLIAGAPDAYDTLKEIAEYISQDQSGASAMTASINKNAQNIEELKTNSATKQELLETEKLIDVKIEDAIISKLRSDY